MKMKKIFYSALVVLFIAAVFAGSAGAVEKEEVAYVNLENDGSVEHVFVVNIMNLEAGESFTDYGAYKSVRNMVTSDPITLSGDVVSGTVSKAVKLFYEGDYGAARIPWDISITYHLNGEEISADDVAGKSGYLVMNMDITKNPYVDEFFFKNYALQITVSLDANKCTDISANGATIANVGANKQLTFTQMPDKEAHLVMSSNVVDFSMDAISINGVRLSLNIDVDTDEIKEDLEKLEDAGVKLDDGVADLVDGVNKLMNGQMALEGGAAKLSDGASMAVSNVPTLIAGANSLVTGLSGLKTYANYNYSDDSILTEGLNKSVIGATQLSYGLQMLGAGAGSLSSGAQTLAISEAEMTTAMKKLLNGVNELKDGTVQLRDNTTGIQDKFTDKIDKILDPLRGGDKKKVSYVSSKNTEVTSVQFAMHTKNIQVPETEKPEPEPKKQLNFFQRILALFGL